MLYKQLERDEGVSLSAYKDTRGYYTIGVGHKLGKSEMFKGMKITQEECDRLFKKDVQDVVDSVNKKIEWINELDEVRAGVLYNMAFNLGVSGLLKFKNTLRLIKEGKYAKASEEMLKSTWATQVKGRANRLSEQMFSGVWN